MLVWWFDSACVWFWVFMMGCLPALIIGLVYGLFARLLVAGVGCFVVAWVGVIVIALVGYWLVCFCVFGLGLLCSVCRLACVFICFIVWCGFCFMWCLILLLSDTISLFVITLS